MNTDAIASQNEWAIDGKREDGNRASSSGANQVATNLRHLQDDRQLGIGHEPEKQRVPS